MPAMPTLFLVAALLGALLTLNAYFPNRSLPRLSAVSFFFGWLTSELALHHVLWEVGATLVFIHLGALTAWPGYVGLAVAFANWSALLYDWGTGWRSRDAVRAGLDEALGPDWRKRLRPELAEKITRVAMRQLLFPIPVTHPDVVAKRNVTYYEEPKFKLRLDIYRHRSKPTKTPTFVYVHGGAWVIGDKSNQGLPILQHMAALGWTCFGVNYRLSPRATFPDHLIDVKRALAWVKEHGPEYGADPSFVVLCGGSAGGHLSALTALTARERIFQPGFEQADCSVQACIPLYGVFDFTDRAKAWPHLGMTKLVAKYVLKSRITKAPKDWDRASPLSWVGPHAPPFFVIHGERDSLVPPAESRNFAHALRDVSPAPVALAIIPGAQHAFEIFPSPRAAGTIEGIADFAVAMYSEHIHRAVGLGAEGTVEKTSVSTK
jgi:acetyl esterase/lipase